MTASATSAAPRLQPAPPPAAAPEATGRVVVIGLGNNLLADDGVGVLAIQRLQAEMAGGDAPIDWIDGGTLNFSLLHYLEGARALIVIDAAQLHAPAGTVRVYQGEEMDSMVANGRRSSVHEAGLADLMAMARLKDWLPAHRALITVQPQRVDWGEHLSAPVAQALPGVCERARLLALRWTE